LTWQVHFPSIQENGLSILSHNNHSLPAIVSSKNDVSFKKKPPVQLATHNHTNAFP
jgi:hypothetical protein